MDVDKIVWNMIDTYFKDNPNWIVKHHTDSYNLFLKDGIKQIFREKNPIRIMKDQDPKTNIFANRCNLYLGGKNGDKIYYGKPVIYDDNDDVHFMYPNEARLRNMTYGFTIHYDVEVEFTIQNEEEPDEPIETSMTLEKILLGRFPIMLQSNLCILKNLSREARFNMGECRNDPGGYFIIDGKEKSVICQEKFADNTFYIRDKVNDLYSHSAEIRSVSEDASKPIRTVSARIVASTDTKKNEQIVVNVPNVRKPVPLFILMRALGVVSDKSIIQHCLLDLDKNDHMVDLFIPSIYDAGEVFSQQSALKYIATLTKGKTTTHVLDILMNYFLPHVSISNLQQKAYFVGYLVYRLLRVYIKEEAPTDRDNFKYKRIELTGNLMHSLFMEYYTLQLRNIFLKIDKEYHYHEGAYQKNFISLIENNYQDFFKERVVETGFRKAFKGNWGSEAHTKRAGIVQDLNRLSRNSALSQLRKTNLDMDASAKVIGPRLCHGSQWGIIDPVDTPDGGNVGLHKHLALSTHITKGYSSLPMIEWLREKGMQLLQECSIQFLSQSTKIFVNGSWIGVVTNPVELLKTMKLYRRLGAIPVFSSIYWNIANSEIVVYTDAGRPCRPLLYVRPETKTVSYDMEFLKKPLEENDFYWNELFTGFVKKNDGNFNMNNDKFYELNELYGTRTDAELIEKQGILEYLDSSEQEGCLISTEHKDFTKSRYTNVEIHPSLLLGVMGNQIVFPENNQLPRDLFSCGQSKQAVSLYHSNFQNRIDKMGVILNYGQIPLVKSRYTEYIHKEEHPYGENPIVAIMCYNGYNVEDAILFNEASVKRGMFRTTYFNMYEAHEESTKVVTSMSDTKFTQIEGKTVSGLKPGVDYSYLDKYGLVKENTFLHDKIALIGRITNTMDDPDDMLDASITPKKGQLGFVDKSFITEGEEGFRIAKVRIREERVPAIGDKFCSRCGQKGTVGLLVPEHNMPFTDDGIRPDIIVNPHALPSRMTIGQLVETLMGKACVNVGGFGDCTAFTNKGPKHKIFGAMLQKQGYHSSGTQYLYNGMTGEQMESEIFIGPTYYMRLKHMVKDKINYRARGPRTALTRQTVQGRANDGGLRIGEMERDGLISHGVTNFINESMMTRGDEYFMAVCNKTGTIAVYNESKNLFISPMADGPIKFSGTLQEDMNIQNLSRFGRDFSVVRVPYSLKLLYQELQSMNVQMRIITEDNIDQLTTMGYSDNIVKLTKNENITPLKVAEKTNSNLKTAKIDPYLDEIYKYEGDDQEDKEYYKGEMFLQIPNEINEKIHGDPSKRQPFATTPPTPGALMTPTTSESSEYKPYLPTDFDDEFGDYANDPIATQPPVLPQMPPGAPVTPNYMPVSPSYAPVSPSYAPVSPVGPPLTPPGPPGMPVTPPGPPLLPVTPVMYNPPVTPPMMATVPVSPNYAPVSPAGPPVTPAGSPYYQVTAPPDPNLARGVSELTIKKDKNVKFDDVKDKEKQSGGDKKTLLFTVDKVDKDDSKDNE